MTDRNCVIFVIDDDISVRRSLSYLLQSADYKVETFESAESFLKKKHFDNTGCIILDIQMSGMSGMSLQKELNKADCDMPIIFITGHGDIKMGIKAMKRGAVDFLPKPFDDEQLLQAVKISIEKSRESRAKHNEIQSIRTLIDKLTSREYEIYLYVITGMLNKQIAAELNIAEHTVKIHRGRVMQKLGAYSVVDLVHLAEKAGINAPDIKKY
jgi:FixJ family two-component response regulator